MVSPLLPLLLSSAFFGDVDRPSTRLVDQNLGLAVATEQLLSPRYGYYVPSYYFRPWADLLRQQLARRDVSCSINIDENGFKIILDVTQFAPEEIEIKVVDKYIVVEAKHDEKKDEHGLISRQFVRRYVIPDNVDAEKISSTISSDGVLTIEAPVKEQREDKNVRKIKIELTGKPALEPVNEKKQEASTTTDAPKDSTTPRQ